MQAFQELICSECQNEFKTASALLQHFALHASTSSEISLKKTCRQIPDLYPINFKKKIDSDVESDSGVEDVNPMKFCLVTMDEDSNKSKKYECNYCSRKFGWSTDLKRHILMHTGEKPFRCDSCDSAFTRNFLLKKHQRKYHNGSIPDLKPLKKATVKM